MKQGVHEKSANAMFGLTGLVLHSEPVVCRCSLRPPFLNRIDATLHQYAFAYRCTDPAQVQVVGVGKIIEYIVIHAS